MLESQKTYQISQMEENKSYIMACQQLNLFLDHPHAPLLALCFVLFCFNSACFESTASLKEDHFIVNITQRRPGTGYYSLWCKCRVP